MKFVLSDRWNNADPKLSVQRLSWWKIDVWAWENLRCCVSGGEVLAYNGAEIRFFWQLSGSDSLQVVNKRKNAFSPLKINLALIYSGEGLDDGGTDQTERRRINTTAEQKTAKGCAQRYYFIQAWSVWIQRHIKAIWGNFSIIWPLKWQETEKYQSHDQSLSHKVTKPTKINQNIKSIFFAALDLFVHLISICLMNHMCKDFSFFLWQFSKPEIRSRRYQNHDLSFKQHFAINQSIRHS